MNNQKIRNIAIIAHVDHGKTSLLESVLFAHKKIASKGKIDSGNTVSDFTKEEKVKIVEEAFLNNIPKEKVREICKENLAKIEEGIRDFRF